MYINKKQLEKGEFGVEVKFNPLFNRTTKTEVKDTNLFKSISSKAIEVEQKTNDYRHAKNRLTGEMQIKFRDMFFKSGHGTETKSFNKKSSGIEINSKTGKLDENIALNV